MMKIKFYFFVLVLFFFLIPIALIAYVLSSISKLLDNFVDWANLKIEYQPINARGTIEKRINQISNTDRNDL